MARYPQKVQKRDPFRNFNFVITLGGKEVAACKKMSGLTASVEVVKFRAGNSLSTVDEVMPGRLSYEPVTLEAGLTNSKDFEGWANMLAPNDSSKTKPELEPKFRKDVVIKVKDIDNNTIARKYKLHRAWVSKYTALSELAGDANEVIVETIEIQHEGFVRIK